MHKVSCPSCAQTLTYSPQQSGKQVKCPRCQTTMQLPNVPFASPPIDPLAGPLGQPTPPQSGVHGTPVHQPDFQQHPSQFERNLGNQKTFSKGKPNTGYGILSYVGILIIIPLMDDKFKNTKYGRFHINQALVLYITGAVIGVFSQALLFIPFAWFFSVLIVMPLLSLGMLILWIIAVVDAAKGNMTKLPIIGDYTIF